MKSVGNDCEKQIKATTYNNECLNHQAINNIGYTNDNLQINVNKFQRNEDLNRQWNINLTIKKAKQLGNWISDLSKSEPHLIISFKQVSEIINTSQPKN